MKTKTNRAAQPAKTTATATDGEKAVALTLKINSDTYVRLSTLRARERRTAQDILSEALADYLDRAGL